MNNAVQGKTMEKFNRIDVRLVRNEEDYLKWHQNQVFDNDLVPASKSKVTLILKKPAYIVVYGYIRFD